jgi:hypothetical protein
MNVRLYPTTRFLTMDSDILQVRTARRRRIMHAYMRHRLVAFASALMFAGLPVVTVVCEATCAQHTIATGGDHRCCHGARPGTGAGLAGVASLCDHPDARPANSALSQDAVNAPAVAETIALADAHAPDATQLAVLRLVSIPPDLLSLTTQLRI